MDDFLYSTAEDNRWRQSLSQMAVHTVVVLLAFGIALSLPAAAHYILYRWWPLVASDKNQPALEVGLSASLVLIFNFWRTAWENRDKGRVADAAALVYARHRASRQTRWRERRLIREMSAACPLRRRQGGRCGATRAACRVRRSIYVRQAWT